MARIAIAAVAAIALLYIGITLVKEPRGIRNNNPGNIRKGVNWFGLADVQDDPEYAKFIIPEYGIRAMARLLRTYREAYGLITVEMIISRWAPASENHTADYIRFVADRLEVNAKTILHFSDAQVAALISAIIHFENGQQPYDQAVILAGINLERNV